MSALLAQASTFNGPEIDWWALSPLLVLVGGGLALLVASALTPRWPKGAYAAASVTTASAALVLAAILWFQVQDDGPELLAGGALRLDGFSLFLTIVICLSVILSSLVADDYLRHNDMEGSELYGLFLMAAVGGIVMASAADLIVLFLGLETLSIALYVMAGSDLRRLRSLESAMKYFVLGAFASAFFLYGVALDLRRHGHHQPRRHLRVPADDGAAGGQAAAGRHGPAARRPRVQGRGGAVPLVDARRLRGCAHAGHRVLRLGGQGGRLRGTAAGLRRDLHHLPGRVAARGVRPRRPHPAGRGDPGHRADQREADDGVLVDQPRRVHPRRGARWPRPTASRPRCCTCWSTP